MAKASTNANVTLSLTDKMSAAVKKVSRKLKGMGIAAGAAGTAISASLGAAALKFAETGDKVDKLRAKTGFAAHSITELAHAASSGGADFDTMADALKDMSKFSGDLATGSTGAVETLKNLGISAKAFKTASPDEKLDMLADALKGITDPGKRAALVMQVMGEAGYKMLPLLTQGSEGLQAMRDEANALGITMDEETATSAAALTEAMGRMQTQLKYVVIQIGAALAPALVKISTYITPIISKVIEFVKNNRMLIVAVGAVGVALVAAGAAMVGIAAIVTTLASAFAVLTSSWLIAGPLLVALFASILSLFVDWQAVFVPIQELSDNLWGSMLKGWEGVKAAISSGDFGLAFEIAMKSAEIALFEALDRLWGGWRDFGAKIVNKIRDVIKTVQGLWSKGVDWIADKIIKVGMAVGLIDEATGKQMLIESAKIGEERTERIQSDTDSIADGIITELRKDRAELDAELDKMVTKAIENAPVPELVVSVKVPEVAAVKDAPKALITDSGTTGGFSAASVLSQLGKDQVQKDQLTELKSINDNIQNLEPAEGGFAA